MSERNQWRLMKVATSPTSKVTSDRSTFSVASMPSMSPREVTHVSMSPIALFLY